MNQTVDGINIMLECMAENIENTQIVAAQDDVPIQQVNDLITAIRESTARVAAGLPENPVWHEHFRAVMEQRRERGMQVQEEQLRQRVQRGQEEQQGQEVQQGHEEQQGQEDQNGQQDQQGQEEQQGQEDQNGQQEQHVQEEQQAQEEQQGQNEEQQQ
ncbi:uncharacterized protein DMAD_13548 [Drosophila madeirensis]|uniref:Uncharacterized protein n=1 Tax=Drosophila madeirensis TaxID=30013 RepID=A0AAU9FK78_DROMD